MSSETGAHRSRIPRGYGQTTIAELPKIECQEYSRRKRNTDSIYLSISDLAIVWVRSHRNCAGRAKPLASCQLATKYTESWADYLESDSELIVRHLWRVRRQAFRSACWQALADDCVAGEIV